MTGLAWLGLIALSVVLAMLSGAVTGTRIAGPYLGRDLAALMGAFFGPAAVLPAAVLGLTMLAWLR
jgi:hypothetical protein